MVPIVHLQVAAAQSTDWATQVEHRSAEFALATAWVAQFGTEVHLADIEVSIAGMAEHFAERLRAWHQAQQ